MKRTLSPPPPLLMLLVLGALLGVAGAAWADEPNACEAQHSIDKYALLRRLSLDLRGRMPSIEEYEALDAVDDVPPATVQEFLESDDFRLAMRRYHEALFWPNIDSVKLGYVNATLTGIKEPTTGALRIGSLIRATAYRGDGSVSCGDYEQTKFDPAHPGEFRPDPSALKTDPATGGTQEGFRMVAPYWDPTHPVKVCAFDAQETVSVTQNGKKIACNTPAGNYSLACGCGKNLEYCYSNASIGVIHSQLREQLARSVDRVTSGEQPYTDLILSHQADENGPIAFWRRNLAPNLSTVVTYNDLDPGEPIAAISDFNAADTWKTVDLGEQHAGVLSLPAYLLRFQTNRGRANRFRIDFMCEYFVPPDHLDPQPGCSADTNDLTQRCNCQYCHQKLEPLAASFAGFAEAGTTLMTDESVFPKLNPACVTAKPTPFCARFYVTQSGSFNAGSLLAWQYAGVHPEYATAIEAGPVALAHEVIDDGTFASCTVKRAFGFLVKRDPVLDGTVFDEQGELDTLAKGFADQGYDFRWLIQQIVSLHQYRRAR